MFSVENLNCERIVTNVWYSKLKKKYPQLNTRANHLKGWDAKPGV